MVYSTCGVDEQTGIEAPPSEETGRAVHLLSGPFFSAPTIRDVRFSVVSTGARLLLFACCEPVTCILGCLGGPIRMHTTPFRDGNVEIPPPLLEAPETNPQPELTLDGRSIHDEVRMPVVFRHSGWKANRIRVAAALQRTGQTVARCDEFRHCGSHAYVLRSCDDPTKYRIAGSCCRDRFCLPCATERSYIIAGNVTELIHDKQVRFLTLTIKTDGLTLPESLDKIYSAFVALRRRSIWKNAVDGGVAFTELKWSATKQRWHPHLHCLIEGRFIRQQGLASTWREITKDSYVVDIRRPSNMDAIARYVTKYASKPFNDSYLRFADRLDEAVVALKSRRLAVTFGTWRGILLTATPDEGAWEHVATLATVLYEAAHGDDAMREILSSITDRNMDSLYKLAPARPPPPCPPIPSDIQLEWFEAWQSDGTYRRPHDD